jgi:hypothetical protein
MREIEMAFWDHGVDCFCYAVIVAAAFVTGCGSGGEKMCSRVVPTAAERPFFSSSLRVGPAAAAETARYFDFAQHDVIMRLG